jgi:hypothetical protein
MLGLAASLRHAYRLTAVLPLLLFSARYHCYRGRRDLARERLIQAVTLVPGSFHAHLRLGAIYLQEHDFYRAKREFLRAREINPPKFRRLYPLVTGASGDANINLFYFPGYTDSERDREAPKNFLTDFIGEPNDETRAASRFPRYGDFSSFREVRKFREMGSFRPDELQGLDWEELERQFQKDAESLEN